jgi:hypothetical protein
MHGDHTEGRCWRRGLRRVVLWLLLRCGLHDLRGSLGYSLIVLSVGEIIIDNSVREAGNGACVSRGARRVRYSSEEMIRKERSNALG